MKIFLNLNTLVIIAVSLIVLSCAASKTSVDPYVGEWHYTFPTMDGGEMDAIMTINKSDAGYTGFLSSDMGSVDLEDLVIEDGKLTANFEIQGYGIDMKGSFEGDTYTGTTGFDGNEYPMKATRKSAEEK
jgi:hypothetical protein